MDSRDQRDQRGQMGDILARTQRNRRGQSDQGASQHEKLLPQNVEAEASALGSLLIDPEAIVEVVGALEAVDFYRETHRTIYQAICDLWDAQTPADLITLTDELGRRGQLEDVGGASYVSSLANQVPTSANLVYYANIVREKATLRRLIHAAGQIAGVAYNEPDGAVALEQAEKLIFEVAAGRSAEDEAKPLSEVFDALVDKLAVVQQSAQNGVTLGTPSGFRDWDRMTGGLQPSDLVILAARPAVGKTSLALSVVDNILDEGRAVLIFSLEMAAEQLAMRLLSMRTGISVQDIRLGRFNEDQYDQLITATGEMGRAKLFIDDKAAISLSAMCARARRVQMRQPLDLIVVDYLQLMDGRSDGSRGNRQEEVATLARGLKELARELNVPVLALSQLSRAVEARENKVPQLSDLRESGEVEQAADQVTFIYRDVVYNPDTERPNIADIIIAKQRNGPTGTFSLYFAAERTRYRDLFMGATPDAPEPSYPTDTYAQGDISTLGRPYADD